jgi:hypothetical protein
MSKLYQVFGEFDSAEEINLAAAGLKAEGDITNIYVLAKENGIEKEDVEDYVNGDNEELTDPMSAAIGKLTVELQEIDDVNCDIASGVSDYLKTRCYDKELAKAIRSKVKSLADCVKALYEIAKKQVKKKSGHCAVCINPKKVFAYAEEYYLKAEPVKKNTPSKVDSEEGNLKQDAESEEIVVEEEVDNDGEVE